MMKCEKCGYQTDVDFAHICLEMMTPEQKAQFGLPEPKQYPEMPPVKKSRYVIQEPRRRNTPILELLKQYEEECCDHSDMDWVVRSALRYVDTMEDSQVRCLLYVLANHVKNGV